MRQHDLQHPIVEGSGTGGFEAAKGRVDFKDIIGDPLPSTTEAISASANTAAKCKYSGAGRLGYYFAADSGRDDAAVGQGGWSSNSQGEYSFQTSQLTTTHNINSADPPTARRPPTDITNALRSLLIVLPPCVVTVPSRSRR